MQNTSLPKKQEKIDLNIGKFIAPYTIMRQLGKGSFGTVYECKNQADPNKKYAVKIIPQNSLSSPIMKELFNTEIQIMQQFDHPGIMNLYDMLESTHNVYLIMNFCSNGDMSNYMKKRGLAFFNEYEAQQYLKQIAVIFQELHKKQVMHRDFKLENMFMDGESIVIGDFGLSKKGKQMTTTGVGTPMYMAPEILQGKSYNNQADLWSVGVTYYEMLFGKAPFSGKDEKGLLNDIMKNSGKNLKFPTYINKISMECMCLLRNMLEPIPSNRILWSQFFRHKIFEESQNTFYERQQNKDPTIRMFESKVFLDKNFYNVRKEYADGKKDYNYEDYVNNADNTNILNGKVKVVPVKKMVKEESTDDVTMSKIQGDDQLEQQFENYSKYYSHEKQRVDFIATTAQKLRALFKNLLTKIHVTSIQIPEIVLMYLSLYKIFMLKRLQQYYELKEYKNVMNFKCFSQYSKTSTYKDYLYTYEKQLPEIKSYFNSLAKYPNDIIFLKPDERFIMELQSTKYDIQQLPPIVDQKMSKLKTLLEFNVIQNDKDQETELILSLYYTHHAIRTDKFFEYKPGKTQNFNSQFKSINNSNPVKLKQFISTNIK